MKKHLKLFLSISMLSLTTPVLANNGCGYLYIDIANGTNKVCQLISKVIVHGDLITLPPTTIFPNDYGVFEMQQSAYYGPHITLKYRCDQEIFTFTSQQNYCFFEAGNITGSISQPLPRTIDVTYNVHTGSYGLDLPGVISWVFTPKYH